MWRQKDSKLALTTCSDRPVGTQFSQLDGGAVRILLSHFLLPLLQLLLCNKTANVVLNSRVTEEGHLQREVRERTMQLRIFLLKHKYLLCKGFDSRRDGLVEILKVMPALFQSYTPSSLICSLS